MSNGGTFYTHFTYSGERVYRDGVQRTFCGDVQHKSRTYYPRPASWAKVTCPSCLVAWDAWNRSAPNPDKPMTLRRVRELLHAQGFPPRFIPPRPADAPVTVQVGSFKATVPGNAPEDVRAAVERELEAKAEVAEKARAQREYEKAVEHARERVKRLTSRIKALTTRRKKWERRLKRLESKSEVKS